MGNQYQVKVLYDKVRLAHDVLYYVISRLVKSPATDVDNQKPDIVGATAFIAMKYSGILRIYCVLNFELCLVFLRGCELWSKRYLCSLEKRQGYVVGSILMFQETLDG